MNRVSEVCHRRSMCRLCNSSDLQKVIALAPTPPANAFLNAQQISSKTELSFPLDVFKCSSCHHVQLLDVVSPEVLFENYVYVSGTSPSFVNHFKNYANTVTQRFQLNPNEQVVEIGSNDGTLLKFFKEQGFKVLGIDPAKEIAEQATSAGIPTLARFFSKSEGEKIQAQHGKACVVLANNVFAHIDDLTGVAEGIKELLLDKGVFVFEVSYLVDVLEKTLFDTIYHEHLCYHSVTPLIQFFDRLGLQFFDAERVSSHGGSLRGYVQHKDGPYAKTDRLQQLLNYEAQMRLDDVKTYKSFENKINDLGHQLKKRLIELKKSGKKLGGFGAPAKATTLMHQFQIDRSLIDFIIDDSPLKQGLFSPGLHIPVVASTAINDLKPDYLVILAWNFSQPIIEKNTPFLKQGGHFITPLPQLQEI